MKQPPTDLEIIEAIWERYYDTYAEFRERDKSRKTKNYVPIDGQPHLAIEGHHRP